MARSRRRSNSSGRWLQEHHDDMHVKRAQRDGYRSRAVYKLIEIDQRDSLIRPGSRVLELGAAPGGWTQYLAERVGADGLIVATDILPMDGLGSVMLVQGDFTEPLVADEISAYFGDRGADLVLSDMAPNLTGVADIDQARSMALADLALDMAAQLLNANGRFLVKVFQGAGYDAFLKDARHAFTDVRIRKPKASRARSREVYVLAANLV